MKRFKNLALTGAVLLLAAGCASFPDLDLFSVPKEEKKSLKPGSALALLTDIKSEMSLEEKVIRIIADRKFKYITYMLKNPRRLAVEIAGMANSLPTSSIIVDDAMVRKITIVDFKKVGAVRVEIWLKRSAKYDLSQSGKELAVSFTPYDATSDPSVMAENLIENRAQINSLQTEVSALKEQLQQLRLHYNIDENIIADLIEELENLESPPTVSKGPPVITEPKVVEAEAVEKPEEKIKAGAASEENKISGLITQWLAAWRDRDIESYSTFYSGTFASRGKSRERWLEQKRAKFGKTRKVSVEAKNINIAVDGGEAVVKFMQLYSSDRYSDVGIKTLLMVKVSDGWKIESEKWEPKSAE